MVNETVRIGGVKCRIQDLPLEAREVVQAALDQTAEEPAPTLWPEPLPGEDLLYVSQRGSWYHRCGVCSGNRWIPLNRYVVHQTYCRYFAEF